MKIVKVLDIPKKLSPYNLPSSILKHCNLYKDEKAKNSSIFAWDTLGKYIDLTKVKFNENGKPYSLDKNVYFSLSHSLNKIAIAVSNKPIGIDIETLLPLTICRSLAQRLLNEKQLNNYFKAKDREIWFTKYWTQHEAYIKLNGDAINLKNLQQDVEGSVETKQIKDNHNIYFVSTVQKK